MTKKSVPQWLIVCGGNPTVHQHHQQRQRNASESDQLEAWSVNLGIVDELLEITERLFHDEDGHRGVYFAGNSKALRLRVWHGLLEEFHKFICQQSDEYRELRESLNRKSNETSLVVVATISAAVAPHIGVFAGVIVPFCSFVLLAAKNVGVEVFCQVIAEELQTH